MCGADRLVLVVNDECLSDSALRGGQLFAFVVFQNSLHVSAEMADLQNIDYLSMFSAVCLASVVNGHINDSVCFA